MSKTMMFVGCYTQTGSHSATAAARGIAGFNFDEATGRLSHVSTITNTDNPSFLAASHDGRTLYAVNEIPDRNEGTFTAYRILPSGSLSYVNMQPSRGSLPAQLSFDRTEKFVLAINYSSGPMTDLPNRSLVVFPRGPGGELLPPVAEVSHRGHGPNATRQERPHPHSVQTTPDNRFAVVADLGLDRLIIYRFDASTGVLHAHSETSLPPGSGPRHFAFHPRLPFAYVANELTSTVASLAFDAAEGTFSVLSVAPAVRNAATDTTYCSEITFGPGGRNLYVANRGDDSISCFGIDEISGIASLENSTPSGGKIPRHFAFDPTGNFLAVANQNSDSIAVFSFDRDDGKLSRRPEVTKSGMPTCIVFTRVG